MNKDRASYTVEGVKTYRLTEELKFYGRTYPAGTLVTDLPPNTKMKDEALSWFYNRVRERALYVRKGAQLVCRGDHWFVTQLETLEEVPAEIDYQI